VWDSVIGNFEMDALARGNTCPSTSGEMTVTLKSTRLRPNASDLLISGIIVRHKKTDKM
jgi:hypothetical protein